MQLLKNWSRKMDKELPVGWIETELGKIAEWGSGGTPNRNEVKYYNGDIPWIKTGDLNDSIITDASEFITDLGLKHSSAKLFPKGSIILAMYGATIGKTAKLGIDAATNQACAIAQTHKIVNPDFLHYYLKAEKQNFIDKGKGGAQPNISQTVIKEHPFPLPPLPEQQRIVAKLDTLFGQLDRIKASMERIPQLLKDFRQKVLTQAVTGKLTEEWRDGKDLERIELVSSKYSIEFELLEKCEFPESWEYIALGNYAECSRGKFTARPRNDPQFFDGEYPFMQIGDLPENGGLFFSYSSTLNEKGKSVSKCFPKGTIVIAIVGATIGNTGILEKEVFFPDSLIGINSEFGFSNFYIEYYLRRIKLNMRELSYAGGGQPNIKLPNITNLGIPLPSHKEQQEIVRRVESLFAKADRIEASYQKLQAKLEQLPQALLAKAFRGELVEQLPTDGDARELLEHIKKLNVENK
jgi:type I restriction enzyme S subunit